MARKRKQVQFIAFVKDFIDLERLVEKGWRIVALAPAPGHSDGSLVAIYE